MSIFVAVFIDSQLYKLAFVQCQNNCTNRHSLWWLKKTQISEKIVFTWKHLANKCQASSVWFALSLPLGFRHFDIYRFWETLSYLCWYFCRTQRRVCAWVLKIIKHKHEWKQDVLNHNCLFGNTKHLVPISIVSHRQTQEVWCWELLWQFCYVYIWCTISHPENENCCLLSTGRCDRNIHTCYLIQSLDIWC